MLDAALRRETSRFPGRRPVQSSGHADIVGL